jgi:ATP-dependent helicase HrpB
MTPLPVDERVDEIVDAVRRKRRAIIVAPPGSGKTTRIPPALTALGRTILLQPRRVAARALARRIAAERQWTVGHEIGWHIRFERRFASKTQLLVATEGILTARLQSDPLLSDFSVVVLDEFHERSIHADLALALARQAALSRDDLAIVVMSATIDAKPLAAFLDADVIEVNARQYPIETHYRPGLSAAAAVRDVLPTAKGHLLAFLPGAREIERARGELAGLNALPLHGSLDVDEQERALAPSKEQKIILATNVAETSLTVEGVTDVIDSGLHKILRFDSDTAVDHLMTEQITGDSAAQRAGRAGRTGPGRATRLWDERMILRPHREPEVGRIDLAGPVLDIIAWGGDPETFEWFERPPAGRIAAALDLLRQLGAVEGRRLTAIGEQIRDIPLHPRLARVVIESSDAIPLVAEIAGDDERELRNRVADRSSHLSVNEAFLKGYPDRVAMRRGEGLLLATGTGARLAREIEHTPGDFFVVLEIRGEIAHRVLPIEREWLVPTTEQITHDFVDRRVRATKRRMYGAIVLHEQQVPPDPIEEHRLLAENRHIDPELQRRARFAGVDADSPRLSKLAPTSLPLPSGRSTRLDYRDDGSVFAAVKLQELFGLAETPTINGVPITFELLAPNGRPVQITRDLRSFWNGAYQQVRKELRARYPKHPWPEDPWTATPTHRTKRR